MRWFAMIPCLLLCISLHSCSDDSEEDTCEPGDMRICVCPDGANGIQICRADKHWGKCVDCGLVPDFGTDAPQLDAAIPDTLTADGPTTDAPAAEAPVPDEPAPDAPVIDAPIPDLPLPKECTPACTTGSCCDGTCVELGSDPNNCGKCEKACQGSQKCVAGICRVCAPQCSGKECGPDGCGGTCGTGCGANQSCDTTSGTCVDCAPIPICRTRVCGDDGCGHSCGTCAANKTCINGQCVNPPSANCSEKNCGDPNGAGGFCQSGPCPGGGDCSDGECSAICRPDCSGKQCGNDGCGGTCGECSDPFACSLGQCICIPWCGYEDRECGPDGCGGVCGTCSTAPKTYCSGLAICTEDPSVVGCSDGTREGFLDKTRYPTIASCAGTFPQQSMRVTRTGEACGNFLSVCVVPEDLCSQGWHLCSKNGWPGDLADRVSGADCLSPVAGFGQYLGGSSQATASWNCTPPLPCSANDPLCCGSDCTFNANDWNDCVWLDQTGWSGWNDCDNASAKNGVLCCKDPPVVGH